MKQILKTTPEYLLGLENKSEIITKEKLTKENIAFFEASDISDDDKKQMLELLQDFYFKQKFNKKKNDYPLQLNEKTVYKSKSQKLNEIFIKPKIFTIYTNTTV